MSKDSLLKFSFFLNGFILILLGGVYLLAPSISLIDGSHTTESYSLLRLLSISLVILGAIAMAFYKNFSSDNILIKQVSLAFIGFHILYCFHWYGYTTLGYPNLGYNIIPHILLVLFGLFSFFRK